MTIGIYGLGRFGAFWCGVCRQLPGVTAVKAYNRSDRPTPEGVERVGLAELAACDCIYLCCAISAMPAVCAELAGLLQPGSVVVDTCSVKVWPVRTMLDSFAPEVAVVASHPMFGPDSARNGLAGLPLMLDAVRIEPPRFAAIRDGFAGLGLRVIEMSPDEHDRQAARTQGLTHYVGRLLAEIGLIESPIATLGYRKLAEITGQTCNDPWQLFVDLQRYNPYTAGMRADFEAALGTLNKRLREDME